MPRRWLKPGGAILPDIATLHIAAAGPAALDTGFWSDVYGFSMEPIAAAAREHSMSDALVVQVAAGAVLTQPAVVRRFNLATMDDSETDFSTDFELTATAEVRRWPSALRPTLELRSSYLNSVQVWVHVVELVLMQ